MMTLMSISTKDTPEPRAMHVLAQEVCRRRRAGDAVPSFPFEASVAGIAWALGPQDDAGAADGWKHRLWFEGDELVAWGRLYPPEIIRVSADREELADATLVFAKRGEAPDTVVDGLLDWFDSEGGAGGRKVELSARDTVMIDVLRRHGYELEPAAPWSLLLRQDLDRTEEPQLPDGFAPATMREFGDAARRSEAHRKAWGSTSLTTECYARLMQTWPYRDDLDVMIVAPDGSIAACANIWFDEANLTGEFEPVGADARFRARGIGKGLMLFGLKQLRDAGATEAVVGCRGDANYPVPQRLYRSAGFDQEVDHSVVWTKPS